MGDTGLTGRKIIVDTYGGAAPHGGGAFSGKDPTKVDRSAAYAARYVAKNVVAAGLADRCQVQVAYAIGVAQPFSVLVETFGTEQGSRRSGSSELVSEHFDLRPAAILRDLDLRRPIYAKTAAYGHFGRDDHDFTWERTDKADALREAAGLSARAPAPASAAQRGRTKRPAAAFSPIAFSPPPTATRNWPAAGSAARSSTPCRARGPGRRTSAGGRRRARRGARSSRARPARARRAARARGSRPARTSGSTGQPCGQRSGWPSFSSIRSTISSRERAAELVGVHVRLGGRVAHEVGEEPLDDPVLAHDLARPLGARPR